MLVRVQAGSEKAGEPWYPWVLQANKPLQHFEVLLPAQLLIVTPLLKGGEPMQSWKGTWCLQLSCCHSQSGSSAQIHFITELGSGKISKEDSLGLISSLDWSFLLSQLPSDIPSRGNMGICIALICDGCTLFGTQHIALLAAWPYARQKEESDQVKRVERGHS